MNGVNTMLGVNSRTRKCCILMTNLTFMELSKLLGKIPDARLIFETTSTNWSGCDDIAAACKKMKLSPTGRKLKYSETLRGSDYDHGSRHEWVFAYNEIWEVFHLS